MSVDFYIHKLLFSNDCVILPGFGGFVSNYASAKVHPINHTFYPPSKSILFNTKLVQDDGLLIHHITQFEQLNYPQAKELVVNFVSYCKNELEKNNKLDLPKIGKIIKDVEGSLLFDPDTEINYLEESFGLPVFVSPAIIRQPIHKRLEKKFTDRRPVIEQSRNKRKIKWAYLLIIPILAIASWLSFNIGNNNDTQESGIVTVGETEFGLSEKEAPDKTYVEEMVEDKNTSQLEIVNADPELEENSDELIEAVEVDPVEIKESTPLARYYIVGGAFRDPTNSTKMIADLRKRGYDATSAGLSKTGLHMVCYLQTSDKSEALMNLSMIRKEDNPSAWLLKK
jgi:hypothetical protein